MMQIILTALALAGCALAAAVGFMLGLKLYMPWEDIKYQEAVTWRRGKLD